jgi:chromosome partitioning protein
MSYKIAIANQKGGVGKTTISLGLAGVLAEMDKTVLLIDMDQQGNLSSVFVDNIHALPKTVFDMLTEEAELRDVAKRTFLDRVIILPSNLSLSDLDTRLAGDFDSQYNLHEVLQELESVFDFVIIDCPPNLGTATRMALVAADGLLIPIECQEWAVKGSSQLESFVHKVKKRANPKLDIMGYVINRYDPRRTIETSYNEVLRETHGDKIFKTEFHNNVQYTESATARQPINFYLPTSPQAELFRQFTNEILNYVDQKEQITEPS